MQFKAWGNSLGNAAREFRCHMRHAAVGVCVMMHAGRWPVRVIGSIAVLLLLPNIILFAPRVLTRCNSFRRFRGR